MKSIVTAIVLILGALGLFLTFTKPNYGEIKTLRASLAAYDRTLEQISDFESLKNRLLEEYNAFDRTEIERLEKMIPLNVDNVRLIIEIEGIAEDRGLEISGIEFGTSEVAEEQEGEVEVGEGELELDQGSSTRPGSLLMTFTVSSSYEDFKLFMGDLEKSLRIVDVEKISSPQTDSGIRDYTISFRTYWLGNR